MSGNMIGPGGAPTPVPGPNQRDQQEISEWLPKPYVLSMDATRPSDAAGFARTTIIGCEPTAIRWLDGSLRASRSHGCAVMFRTTNLIV